MRTSASFGSAFLLFAALAAGCSKATSPPSSGKPGGAEAEVRQKFAEIQSLCKAKDDDRLWALLSSKSRADAEKEAEAVRIAYEKGDAKQRADLEEKSGLPKAELAKLTGKGLLKTKRFRHKLDEIGEGTVTRVTAAEDNATVEFDEPDGDKEKLRFVREDGQWKAWMSIPKVK
jgi:hypothetical protein